jgi:putative oxidoreductase
MSVAAGLVVLAGRILIAIFFGAFAGVGHLRRSAMYEEAAKLARFPIPAIAGWPTGVWLLAGSVSIVFGIWPDVGALMFAAFLVPAALFLHAYWRLDDPAARRTQRSSFYRNVMMLGSSLVMFGMFASFGGAVRFTLTPPLFRF